MTKVKADNGKAAVIAEQTCQTFVPPFNRSRNAAPADTMLCEKCGKRVSWDEYANNFGWCDACLNFNWCDASLYEGYANDLKDHGEINRTGEEAIQ